MEFIDIHPHAVSKDEKRYPYRPVGGKMSDWAKERPVDGDQLLDWMDKAGIRRAVIVHASTAYGYDNSYAADVAAAHHDRLRFVGCVDVTAPDAAQRLEFWVERGMVGLRIFAAGSTMDEGSGEWLADPQTFPAWEKARDLGIPICVQTRFKSHAMLRKLLERFGDVKVILDHFAHPPADDGPPYAAAQPFFDLAQYPNLFLKLTVHNFNDFRKGKGTIRSFIEKTITSFGADRIAWGSNFPTSPLSLIELREMAERELAFLPDAQRQTIFRDTALRLYPAMRQL